MKKHHIETETEKLRLLNDDARFVYKLIIKNHDNFSNKDRRYRNLVRLLKILILTLAMVNTIILGLRSAINIDNQLIIGLVLSSFITFVTAISTYFNFEHYWMRNIAIHIELNRMRDDFLFDVEAGCLDNEKILDYKSKLDQLHQNNIKYWKKMIDKV